MLLPSQKCGLWLRFLDSHDNRPDPLTQLALDDLKSSGMQEFLSNFFRQADEPEQQSIGLVDLIDKKIAKVGPHVPQSLNKESPHIGQVCRVTLCNPQWPDIFHNEADTRSRIQMREAREGLQRTKQLLGAEDMPFAMVARLINTRFWFGREKEGMLRFIKRILRAFTRRKRLRIPSKYSRRLRDYVARVDEAGTQFTPSSMEARCFLWMYCEILQLEAKVLQNCAMLLNTWAVPRGTEKEQTPLLLKILTLPHIVLLVPWRLIDCVEDIVECFGESKPLHIFTAILRLIESSGQICSHFYFHGNVRIYNGRPCDKARRWIEAAMRSEGQTINTEEIKVQLTEMAQGGFV
ncbi:hypothetical protein FDECE_13468 [Fusarium decemcellulare]|nr:hypothetical protein FDECE_13468 [Fusarium decemcellulare]